MHMQDSRCQPNSLPVNVPPMQSALALIAVLLALAIHAKAPAAPASDSLQSSIEADRGASTSEQERKPLTVRVDSSRGAPRWLVNGDPVRARVFWGAPGPSHIPISPTPQRIRFEFVALDSSTNATMHLRFGQLPGETSLDDIQVTDLSDNRDILPCCAFSHGADSFASDWTFWPPDATNHVANLTVVPGRGEAGSAVLNVTLKAPLQGTWPDFHIYHHPDLLLIEGHRYRVQFWAQAQPARPLTVAFYQPGDPFIFLGGRSECFSEQIKLAAEAGVNFVSFPIGLPWPRPGQKTDWHSVDLACKTVLNFNPRALLLPRIPLDPPTWWREAYPDHQMQWENGRRDKAVVASPQYRRDAAQQLYALVSHLEEQYGQHIAGYHPCGQNTGEWFYEGSWEPPLSGGAPADLTAWHRWLKQRYANDDELRRRWGKASLTRDTTAALPTWAERHQSPAGIFRDPMTEQPLIDFAEFQQTIMADCICELAHAVRTASHGRKLVLFFYGYGFEFGGLPNGPATAGHYALRRVLDSRDIDVLCSPISYFDRGLGGSAPAMSAAESVVLAGKMWLNEDDTHTYLATGDPPGSQDHVGTIEDTNQELVRNVAQESCRNFATWWMDLLATGWFNDHRMWTEMTRMAPVEQEFLEKPVPFRPEVAAVLDEHSVCYLSSEGAKVTRPVIYEARAPLGRFGAPYGQYLLDDVLAGRVQARLFVFLNSWRLNEEQRTRLTKAIRSKASIWLYAAGYFDGDRISLEAMQQVTGFHFKQTSIEKAWVRPTEAGRKRGLQHEFGVEGTIRPLLAVVAEKSDEVLATYQDGSTAVALRRGPDGLSMFVGVPRLTSELLRIAGREAGVHLFTQTDCNIYANGPFLALHASQDGSLELNTGKPGPVRDFFTGEIVGQGPLLQLSVRRGNTRVLRY
jgi:beta-galactosidase